MTGELRVDLQGMETLSQQFSSLGSSCSEASITPSDGFGESTETAKTIEALLSTALQHCGEEYQALSENIASAAASFKNTDSSGQCKFNDAQRLLGRTGQTPGILAPLSPVSPLVHPESPVLPSGSPFPHSSVTPR